MSHWLPILLLVAYLALTSVDCQRAACRPDNRPILNLVVSLPYPNQLPLFDPSWNEGERIIPALYLARDQINNSTQLLACHRLELIRVESGCDISATTAVSTVLGLYAEGGRETPVVGMVGPGCSASSLETAHVFNQPQIQLVHVHGGGSPLLGNRNLYENSLGILGSSRSFVQLAVALIKKNDWHSMAVLFESSRVYYESTKSALVDTLDNDQYRFNVTFESPIYTNFYPLDGVRISLSRIIFLFASLGHTRRILCLAYHAEMFYPAYQWVIISHQLDEIGSISSSENLTFTYVGETYTCSIAAIVRTAMEATFLLNYQLQSISSMPKLANISINKFLKLYEERAALVNVTRSYWATYFYDAVWAWARVLDRMTRNNSEIFNNVRFPNKTMTNMILNQFHAEDFEFEGISGAIRFNRSDGFFDRPFNLHQVLDGKAIHVAYNNGSEIVLSEGVTLKVTPDIVRAETSLSLALLAIFAALLFLLFFLLVILHVLTVVYRNSKSVKATSPKLSHFAFLGSYALVFGLLLFLFLRVRQNPPSVSGPICHVTWVWLLPIGFTLSIGTIIIRTWRVYRIFHHYLDPGKLISDPVLIAMLAALVSVDVVVAVLWTAIDRREIRTDRDTIQNGPATELVIIRQCHSTYESVWISIVYSYKIALILVMVLLTLLTRQIVTKNFATTSLQVFSYTFTVVFAIGFGLYSFFTFFASATYRLNTNIRYGILCATTTLMISLYVLCVILPPLGPVFHSKVKSPSWKLSDLKNTALRKISVDHQISDESKVRKTSKDALL